MSAHVTPKGDAVLHCDMKWCDRVLFINEEPDTGWDMDYNTNIDYCPEHFGSWRKY